MVIIMIKDYTSYEKYIKLIKDSNNNSVFKNGSIFHSIIDLNLIKLKFILEKGILSQENIEKNNLQALSSHHYNSFDSKNGKKYISVTKFNPKTSNNIMFSSFLLHTLHSVSLIIDNKLQLLNEGVQKSLFDDEFFAEDKIDINYIIGIFVPSHLQEKLIKDIVCIGNDQYCYSINYINAWINLVESFFNYNINKDNILSKLNEYKYHKINNPYKKDVILEKLFELRKILSENMQMGWNFMLEKKDVNVIQTIEYINDNSGLNLSIYDETGHTLTKQKTL